VSADAGGPLPKWNQSAALKELAERVLRSLRTATDEDLKRAASADLNDGLERFKAAIETIPGGAKRSVELKADAVQQVASELGQLRDTYLKYFKEKGEAGELKLATLLGVARDSTEIAPDALDGDIGTLHEAVLESRLPLRLVGVRELQEWFSKTRGAPANPWLHTPTVVYSRSLGTEALASGGHNLDSAVSRVRRNGTVPRGQFRVEVVATKEGKGTWQIECHPDDAQVVEQNARLISRTEDSRTLESRLKQLVQEPKTEETQPTEQKLALGDFPRDVRGKQPVGAEWQPRETPDEAVAMESDPAAIGNGGGIRPPTSPPPPPGTPPPSEPPVPGPGNGEGNAKVAFELLIIGNHEGRSTLRRESHGAGKVEVVATEHWNRRDLVYAIREEFEAGGRTLDQHPLRISFDETISPEMADKIMRDVSLHLTRARPDRLLVLYRARPEIRVPIEKAEVRGEFQVSANAPRNNIERISISGTVEASSGGHVRSIEFEVYLATPDVVTAVAAKASASQSAAKAKMLDDIAPEVYRGFLKDFSALRSGSQGLFRYGDIGDLHLVEIDHVGRPIGAIAWK
jgi:hypothetical protein